MKDENCWLIENLLQPLKVESYIFDGCSLHQRVNNNKKNHYNYLLVICFSNGALEISEENLLSRLS